MGNEPARIQRQMAVANVGGVIDLAADQIEDAIRYLTSKLAPEQLNPIIVATSDGRARVMETLREAAANGQIANVPPTPAEPLLEELFRATVGLGPIDRFLADSQIEQINILGPDKIIVQQRGTWHQIEDKRMHFNSPAHLRRVAANIVRRVGEDLSPFTKPIMDIRFSNPVLRIHINQTGRDGGVSMFIRRGRSEPFSITQLLEWGNFNEPVADLLIEAAQRVIGCVVLGPVGTGKTALLEVVVNHLPNVPIVVVDDAGDFGTSHPWVAIFDLPATSYTEGNKGLLSLGGMTRAALREGDVLVVAEVRGPEEAGILISDAPSMRAVMTTAHGNSAEAGLSRLVSIAQRPPSPYAGANSVGALRADLATAFPLVIQVERRGDRRYISHIYHNLGWHSQEERWNLRPLVLADFQTDGALVWEIIDGDLDAIKPVVALDMMQRGGLSTYEERDPRKQFAKALHLMSNNKWVEAVHLLSQLVQSDPKNEQTQLKLIEAMENAGLADNARQEASPIIETLETLVSQREWEQVNTILKKLPKRAGVYVFVRRYYQGYNKMLLQMAEGLELMNLANQIHTEMADMSAVGWKTLERQLTRLEAVRVELLPERIKAMLEQTHIDLLQQLISKSPQTNSVYFQTKLSGLVGTRKAEELIAQLKPYTGVT